MLLLFDIDGTLLLGAYHAHRDALHAAVREVHGVELPAGVRVDASGRTDAAIARDLAAAAGVPAAVAAQADAEIVAAACRHYDRLCPDDLSAHVAPGVPEMLAEVAGASSEDGERVLALVTGNFAPIARRKLAAAGIGDWFTPGQGGFGCDHHDRDELPAIARLRAGRRACGRAFPRERTVVIGDTPRDIACARADGVAVVAITTGRYDADALAAADAVVGAASEIPAALRTVLAAA